MTVKFFKSVSVKSIVDVDLKTKKATSQCGEDMGKRALKMEVIALQKELRGTYSNING